MQLRYLAQPRRAPSWAARAVVLAAGLLLVLAVPAWADQVQHPSTPSEGQVTHPGGVGAPAPSGSGTAPAQPAAPTQPGTPPGPAAAPATGSVSTPVQTPSQPTPPGATPAPGAPPAASTASAPGAPPAPRSLDALYRAGEAARRRGDVETAERDFRAVLKQAPYHYLAHLQLGRLYLTRNPALAAQELRKAAGLVPSSVEVHYLLGQAYEALGRDLDAAEQYRRTIYLDPRHYSANARLRGVLKRMRARRSVVDRVADLFYQRPSLASLAKFGRIVMEQMAPRQAVLEFEEMAQRVPALPEVQLWLARARHAADDLPGEIDAYRRYLQQRPQADGVRLLVVQRLMQQGWFEEAAGLLAPLTTAANGQGGASAGLTPDERARVTFLRSRLLSARQQPEQAGAMLLEAAQQGYKPDEIGAAFTEDVALFPDTGRLWLAYGRWLHDARRPAPAAGALAKAGLLDVALRPQARALLAQQHATGAAPVATALALGQLDWAAGDGKAALASLAQVPPGSALDHRAALLRGIIYRAQGNSEAALDAFLRYVLFFTDPGDQLYARGNVFWQTGHPEEALALWKSHPDVLLKHPGVLLHVAERERKAGDVAGEVATRERLAQAEPANAANRIRLGELYEQQGHRLQAVQLWEQVLRQRPRDASLLARVGKAWLALGQHDLAVRRLQQAAQLQALDPQTSAMLARELYQTHQYGAALRAYWSLYQVQPGQVDLPRVLPELVLNVPATPTQQQVAAKLATQAGNLKAAAQVLEAMVDENPHDTDARMSLAEVYLRQNQAQRAQAVLMAPGSGVSDEQGLRLLAKVQEQLGRTAALDDTLARLQQMHPNDPELTRRRGLLLATLRDYTRARPMLEAAVVRTPDDIELQLALAQTALALRDTAEAEQHFNAVLKIDPTQNDALKRMIDLLLGQQRWADAVPRLEAWIKLHPNDATARYNLITADLKLYRKEDARPHYEALRKLSPQRAASLAPYFR